jgi:hypothetical protein
MESDRSYFARRAAEQRRAAEDAGSEEARRRHLQLADLLAARLRQARDPVWLTSTPRKRGSAA